MKKKKNFLIYLKKEYKTLLKKILLSNFLIFPCFSFSQELDLFFYQYKDQIESISKKIINKDSNLTIRVFDTSNKTVNLFMMNNYGNFDFQNLFLSSNFKPNILINDNPSSICVIAYNPLKVSYMHQLYMDTYHASFDDVIFYFSAHELGHCFLYQYLLTHNLKPVSANEHETIADIFAILLGVKYNHDIKNFVLKNNSKLPSNDVHYNSANIELFLNNYHLDNNFDEKKLIEFIYKNYFTNNNSN